MIIDDLPLSEVAKKIGFSEKVVERHAALHVWPVYMEAFKEVCGAKFMGDIPEGGEDALGQLSARALIPRIPALLEKRVAELYRHKLRSREGGISELPRGSLGSYALDGQDASRPLAAWDDTRIKGELMKKGEEALNFYDEMLDIRKCAIRIYDEVMEAGKLKYYPTAVAAIRERRGIVETLGKMSLIAKQLSDETEGKKKLSPGMKSVVDSIFKLLPEDEEAEDEEAEE